MDSSMKLADTWGGCVTRSRNVRNVEKMENMEWYVFIGTDDVCYCVLLCFVMFWWQ
jgi:hypothetical protein